MAKQDHPKVPVTSSYRFVDLYSGCGGFSLGLMMSGWQGVFGIEKDNNAFGSLARNFIDGASGYKYGWPEWLPEKCHEIGEFLNKYSKEISALKGKVDLVVGGPPCQGFSMAGRRNKDDPRNLMFRHYIKVVNLIRPQLIVLENVRGIDVHFETGKATKKSIQSPKPFSRRISGALKKIGYFPVSGIISANDCGVPQNRSRYFIFAFEKHHFGDIETRLLEQGGTLNPLELLSSMRIDFLSRKGLPTRRAVTVGEALSDLSTFKKKTIECLDSPGFRQVVYSRPLTSYQRLLHGDLNGTPPNSMRLVKHRKNTIEKFELILKTCRKGVLLSQADRDRLGMKKHATVPLAFNKPSHTLTTLPDDLLHYAEARILTVRESARLQSFPDRFEFIGKYTTGGTKRVRECPRYTQVGNAVPPLVAEMIGLVLLRIMRETSKSRKSKVRVSNRRKNLNRL